MRWRVSHVGNAIEVADRSLTAVTALARLEGDDFAARPLAVVVEPHGALPVESHRGISKYVDQRVKA